MITSQIKKVVNNKFFLAESPLKISKKHLIWIDIYSKKLIFLNLLNKKIKTKKFTQNPGFVINKKNNLIIGLQNKIINYCTKTKTILYKNYLILNTLYAHQLWPAHHILI